MTDEQILKERWSLYDGENMCDFYRAGKKLSAQKEHRNKELNCLSMINSILAYDWAGQDSAPLIKYDEKFNMVIAGFVEYTPEGVLRKDREDFHSYLTQYVQQLGEKRVLELIKQQMDDISGVEVAVYTDSEGCSYNSIIHKEE